MKTIYFLLITVLIASCKNDKIKNVEIETFESTEFVFTNLTKNDFVKQEYGSEYRYSFVTTAMLKNNTKNFYNSTFISNEITVILENGNKLTNKDIEPNPMPFSDIAGLISGEWEPNEESKIKLETPRMSLSYFKYPIKKIYVDYIISTKDRINNTERSEIFKTIEITEKWKKIKLTN